MINDPVTEELNINDPHNNYDRLLDAVDRVKLRVKIKSLAEEARIIRLEEKRKFYQSIYNHRVIDVRREARATQLAYAFLRGKKYKNIEQKTDEFFLKAYIKHRVVNIVHKYIFKGEWGNIAEIHKKRKDKKYIEKEVERWLNDKI